MQNTKRRWHWLSVLVLAFVFAGCEYEDPFNKPYTPPKPKRIKRKKRMAISYQINPFVYKPTKKRDPFRPPYLTQTTFNKTTVRKGPDPVVRRKKRRKPRTELETFELDQIKVVATVTGVANPIAMVEGPSGKGFVVRRGTSIGRNGGRVTRIYSTGIVISEVSRDERDSRRISRTMIRIKGKQDTKANGSVQVGGRKLYFDANGQPRYRSRVDSLFRRRGVGAQ